MSFNANHTAIVMSAGTNTVGGVASASTAHQLYCLVAGTARITPLQGDSFNWVATANQSVNCMMQTVSVISGVFVAFKAKNYPHQLSGPGI